jgi:hypothetical protein
VRGARASGEAGTIGASPGRVPLAAPSRAAEDERRKMRPSKQPQPAAGALTPAISLLFAALAVACRESPQRTEVAWPAPTAAEAALGGTRLLHHPDLRATVRAPERVLFGSTVNGLDEAQVSISITNGAPSPADVGGVRVSFSAEREGIAFPCEPQPVADARTLDPHRSFETTWSLRCWTPLAGAYTVRAFLALGGDPSSGRGDLAGVFPLEVVDPTKRAARAVAARPGLFALAGGEVETLPAGDSGGGKGGYRIAVVLTNGSADPVAPGTARVELAVFRVGTTIPCTGEATLRSLSALPAGDVQVLHVPVTCIRDQPGDYDVVVRLAIGDAAAPLADIGRVRVRVTRELGIFIPLPPAEDL